MITASVLIDPQKMLRVSFVDSEGAQQIVAALICAYVPAVASDGRVKIAIQIVTDPATPHPVAPYYCPDERLQHLLVAPGSLRGVSPWTTK